MDDKIKSDVVKYGKDVKIVRYQYRIDTKGTYGIVTGQCLMALLSNDKVLEYNVIYHKPESEMPLYYEIFLEPMESTNPEHLKAINKWRLNNYIRKASEKTLLAMGILAIVILGLGLFLFGIYLAETFKWNLLIIIVAYIFLYIFVSNFGCVR